MKKMRNTLYGWDCGTKKTKYLVMFVNSEQFIAEATKMYKLSKSRKSGSVWISFKKGLYS